MSSLAIEPTKDIKIFHGIQKIALKKFPYKKKIMQLNKITILQIIVYLVCFNLFIYLISIGKNSSS